MTYFIGGNWNGQNVPLEELHKNEITDFGEKSKGISLNRKLYKKTKINLLGTTKIFYLIEGSKPIDHRDQIIDLWDKVETETYAI
ncbi:hypothetical protein [Acinetobacter kyonggiensis]|uniref:Uncharacterized protein n=1 Tax=Acinetobacter kyonggiensis TaxID=595670 RepID=A0A1H3L7G9_9GAMM|nr:hypothetical protein [Acinetobacter kyonggiensis]SDY60280.1 hypothetical protein SAMN05421643_11641 [Acinetobacter kyonggiensis]